MRPSPEGTSHRIIRVIALGSSIAAIASISPEQTSAQNVDVTRFGKFNPPTGFDAGERTRMLGGKKISDLKHGTEILLMNSNYIGGYPGSVLVRKIGNEQWYQTSLSTIKDPNPYIPDSAIGFFIDAMSLGDDLFALGSFSFSQGMEIWHSRDGGINWEKRVSLNSTKPAPDHLGFIEAAKQLQKSTPKK